MPLLHPLYLTGYCVSLAVTRSTLPTLPPSHSTGILGVVFLLRSVGCVSLASLAVPLRPALIYAAALTGVVIAKFTEASLTQPDVVNAADAAAARRPVNHEARLLAARRRRTSSAALTVSALAPPSPASTSSTASTASTASPAADGAGKARRTSLPALLANKNQFALLVSQLTRSPLCK